MRKYKNERNGHCVYKCQKSSEFPKKIRYSPISCTVECVKLRFKNHNKQKNCRINACENNYKNVPSFPPWTIEKPHNHANKYSMFKDNLK